MQLCPPSHSLPPFLPHLVCLLPEASIAASSQRVGGGRRGQLCLKARGPLELQQQFILTINQHLQNRDPGCIC